MPTRHWRGKEKKVVTNLITIISIVVGIFSIITAIVKIKEKKIRYWQVETESIFSSKIKEIEKLKILYENQEISNNVIILKTVIENNGKKDIDKSIVHSPLTICFNEGIQLIDAEILDSPTGVNILNKDNSIICNWNLFKKKEYIVIKFLLKITNEKLITIKSEELLKKYTNITYRITDVDKIKKINYTNGISKKMPKNGLISYPIMALFFFITIFLSFSLDFFQVRYQSPLMHEQNYYIKAKDGNSVKLYGEKEKKIVSIEALNDNQKYTKVILVKETVSLWLIIFTSIASVFVLIPTVLCFEEYKTNKRVHDFFYKE